MLVIDRIEGDWAVIEHGGIERTFNIPKDLLPDGIKEGDVIELSITIRNDETGERKKAVKDFLDSNMLDC
ncbi:MAG: hypothetical protein HPY66_0697 [Firmicutes bacterium]|nr:hypothetical protein [Bacillota bacterium]MDI6706968.1 DUF3006 domain-containing protein [Bacillota bacterium]